MPNDSLYDQYRRGACPDGCGKDLKRHGGDCGRPHYHFKDDSYVRIPCTALPLDQWADAEISRLREAIEAAPHEESCLSFSMDDNGRFICLDYCDCWKREALTEYHCSLMLSAVADLHAKLSVAERQRDEARESAEVSRIHCDEVYEQNVILSRNFSALEEHLRVAREHIGKLERFSQPPEVLK